MTKDFVRRIGVLSLGLAVLLGLLLALPAHAQVTGATISGTVTDPSGAAVPNATVAAKNTGTAVSTTATTNADGFYTIPNLLPGTYDVTTTGSGFATRVDHNVTLEVGAKLALSMTLQVGQTTQTVEVTGAAPTVELATSTISGEVTSTTVRELPLNGRDWTQLATLQPGVTQVQTQAGTGSPTVNRGNRGFGTQMSDSGHSPYQNNYRMNGISINDYTNGAPGSVLGVNLGVDAIQEFSVLTTNYTGEYGKTSGMVINAITKSGTNDFHGNAYFFLRSKQLDARGINAPTTNPPFHRNQYGGSFGGPIIKNKTFFFADYEGVNQDLSFSSRKQVPTDAVRSGLFCSVPDSSCGNGAITENFAGNPLFTTMQPYFALWPRVNGGAKANTGGNIGFFNATGLLHITENYVTARVDHHISEKDSFAASFFYDKAPQTQPDPLNNALTGLTTERWMGEMEETHVFSSSLVNAARFGYSRSVGLSNLPIAAINPAAGLSSGLGAIAGHAAPILTVGSNYFAIPTLGSGTQNFHFLNSFQFYDDLFWTKSKHSLKFGVSVERQQGNQLTRQAFNGNFSFSSIRNLMLATPNSYRIFDPAVNFEDGIRDTLFGFYAQDDWKFRSNLTFNLGLRYEPMTRPTDVNNRINVLMNLTDPTLTHVSSPLRSNPYLAGSFQPRIGFAWDPFHDGKTAVRGGFGIFDQAPLSWLWELALDATYPFNLQIAQTVPAANRAGFFPKGQPGNPLIPSDLSTAIAESQIKDVAPPRVSFSMDWNLNLQHQFTQSLSGTIAYVGSRSLHMPNNIDESNVVLPTPLTGVTMDGVNRLLWPFPVGSGTQINPTFHGDIHYLPWDDNGFYDGLQLGVVKRLSQNFQFQGSYSYQRCIDYGSNMNIGDPFNNSIASLFFFANKQQRRGLCDYDINHAGSVNYLWNIPKPGWASGAMSQVLGGWSLGGIITAQTGTPWTALMGGDPLGELGAEQWDFPDRSRTAQCTHPTTGDPNNYLVLSCFSPATAPASFAAQCGSFSGAPSPAPSGRVYCANLLGNTGRNSIYGPHFVNVDFSVLKNFPVTRISEAFNIQFRAEFFNVLNHLNYNSPDDVNQIFNGDGSSTGAVVLDQQASPSRQIQFGLKVNF